MKQQTVIKAAVRNEKGKGSARKLRSKKIIPAVLYGHKIDPVMLAIENSEIVKAFKAGDDTTLIKVQIDNQGKKDEKLVMIRETQRHPVKNNILHLDLFAVNVKEKIHAPVHIRITGESPGVKLGGILRQIVREIEVRALPTDIPQHFEVDISNLEIGDSLQVSDLNTPENVQLLVDESAPILSIMQPTVIKEDEPEEGEEVETEGDTPDTKESDTDADADTDAESK
jgi:large subunit ribosomal protein L25